MALVVEDGTGLSNADALISRADFEAYATARGYVTSSYDGDDDIDPAIRRASAYLNAFTWKGYKLNGRDQTMSWPRTGVLDGEDLTVPSDEVPREVEQASAEAAWYELSVGPLSPSLVLTDRVKREKIGSIETEYMDSGTSVDAARPVVMKIRDLVQGLLAMGSNSLVGTAVRR